MTPRDRLGSIPTREVLVHELGHVVVAAELGLAGASIEFPDDARLHQARAWYNQTGIAPAHIAMRALGGPVTQSLYCPESVELSLRTRLNEGKLFVSVESLAPGSDVDRAMAAHGFQGDFDEMRKQACAGTTEDRRLWLQQLHGKVIAICREQRFKAVLDLCILDLQAWFDEEGDGLEFPTVMILYDQERVDRIRTDFTSKENSTSTSPTSG